MDIEGTADIISSFLNMGEIEKMKKINKSFNKRYSCLLEKRSFDVDIMFAYLDLDNLTEEENRELKRRFDNLFIENFEDSLYYLENNFLNRPIEESKKYHSKIWLIPHVVVENYKQNLVIVLKIFKYAIKLAKITDSKDYRLCLMEKMIHYKNCIGQRNEKSIKYHNEIDSLMKEYFESVL
jgi:hypothetical protein